MRRLLGRLNPVRLAQGLVVLLNVPPFTLLFRSLYALGVGLVVRRLGRHPAVHAVYGTGSFFDGKPLYGHSDIDLVIVLRESVPRSEGVQHDLRAAYGRIRRFFPFLGSWSEKEGSLVFLEEVLTGFPVSASFSVRMKTGQFRLLAGCDVPLVFPGPPHVVELLEEIGTLQRVCLLTGEKSTLRMLFWQRVFTKLLDRASLLGLTAEVAGWRGDARFAFLNRSAKSLYFTASRPEECFRLFLEIVTGIHDELARREESHPVELTLRGAGLAGGGTRPAPPDGRGGGDRWQADILVPPYLDPAWVERSFAVPSAPLTLPPRLFYFSVGVELTVVISRGEPYGVLRRFIGSMKRYAADGDAVVVQAADQLFLLARMEDYVDVIPLDPLVHAPAHAQLFAPGRWEMPASVYSQLLRDAELLFDALSRAYERHTGWLPKRSYPAIYREDDVDTIRDAFDISRSYLAAPPTARLVTDTDELVAVLSERHPNCARMLGLLLRYFRYLETGGHGDAPANNLYRCLHQFMSQLLAGAGDIDIDDPDQKLGLTVGIITRNRAADLANALESLAHQRRRPDEIIIVDNGSTDNTKEVIDSFAGRLTFHYEYLADASIPRARNRVLELATTEIVAFTDDDCGIPEGWLGSIERAFLRADNVGIVGGWVAHWPADVPSVVDTYYEIFHGHKT